MRQELIIKTKTLVGSSDLTIAAPIKSGLVPSIDSVTYKSRVKLVMKALNTSRSSAQEYALLRPFSDSVERVSGIHSVRIAVIDDKVMLAATFDGSFESYLRVLWQKVGTLLDLIFCNTDGHVGSHDHSYEQWREWVHSVQCETELFYSIPGLSFDDAKYLIDEQKRQLGAADTDLAATKQQVVKPEVLAWRAVKSPPDYPPGNANPTPLGTLETVKQGMQALSVLYRLTDMYLPDTPDGDYLQRAAQDALLELRMLDTAALLTTNDPRTAAVRKRFEKQLAWFEKPVKRRQMFTPAPETCVAANVQGGILAEYPKDITHGCLLLIAVDDAAAGARLIDKLLPVLWTHDKSGADGKQALINIAFTHEGLRQFGLSETDLGRFPQEFREGMETRSSLLGDLHANHPRRWRLPMGNWKRPAGAPSSRVEMSAVHLVVQMRIDAGSATGFDDIADSTHPLNANVMMVDGIAGVRILSVQTMRRAFRRGDPPREHFGFVDGLSNPQVVLPAQTFDHYKNDVPLGEILVGHATQADEKPAQADNLMDDGSYLVIRKLRQDVGRFNAVTAAAAVPGVLAADEIKAKMMGRTLDGQALAAPTGSSRNDFNYEADPDGAACPFQAHVRRANPRTAPEFHTPPGRRVPRIMRRGMSYGPPFDPQQEANVGDNANDRGSYFMAYNASIAEQFEVVQRWVSGGNSAGIVSSQSDPLLGTSQPGEPRVFRFNHHGTPRRVVIDGPDVGMDSSTSPPPLIRLEWGMYLFAPAVPALKQVRDVASAAAKPEPVWDLKLGRKLIRDLQDTKAAGTVSDVDLHEAWKAALEDPEERRLFRSAAIWAVIRADHGGVLKTPFGVLVADADLVMQVFADDDQNYSMSEHLKRMAGSFGEIYLGLDRDPTDAGCPYNRLSQDTNAAIQALSTPAAFELARGFTKGLIERFVGAAKKLTGDYQLPIPWELNLDMKEVSDGVLGKLCEFWFGLPGPNGGQFAPGGYRWDWQKGQDKPLYPGNFLAPSRYIFQPWPRDEVADFGDVYGQASTTAALQFVQAHRDAMPPTLPQFPPAPDGSSPAGPAALGVAIFKAFPSRADDDLVARTLVGTLEGLLPTVDGNFRATLNEWLRDGTFWRLRQALGASGPATFDQAYAVLHAPMVQTMQLRPSPELVWRTPTKAHELGNVEVNPGDRVVVSIVSAMQQRLEEGVADVYPVFGGQRKQADKPWGPGLPTHACPGYDAAMGVLLGMFTALLQVTDELRPSPAPLSLTITAAPLP
jgi:Dyp-type peroxidase family